jgi:tRNA-splicing ligase RtcB (3'-phosphate/5'-hydroxy nucleic acid ligase)
MSSVPDWNCSIRSGDVLFLPGAGIFASQGVVFAADLYARFPDAKPICAVLGADAPNWILCCGGIFQSFIFICLIVNRISAVKLSLPNSHEIPVTVFANADVRVEKAAIEELNGVLELQETVERIAAVDPDFFEVPDPGIVEIAVTPDFHKGAGIPIGTVLKTRGFMTPQAIGRDVNCGMRLMLTDWSVEEVRRNLPALEQRIRHVFFEGGREIPLHPLQKQALLREGLPGLVETADKLGEQGIWRHFRKAEQWQALDHVSENGQMMAQGISEGLANYTAHTEPRYDAQIGSIGGGNHFVEVQQVKQILDASAAYQWGLKPGAVVVMIHTGSVSIGYPASGYAEMLLREIYPKTLTLPRNGILPLPTSEKYRPAFEAVQMALANAANFAYANRLFLSMMLRRVFEEALGDREFKLLWDSGHNLVWNAADGSFIHRKGATPARGMEAMAGTPFAYTGEPVLIPGSMGASSFVLRGLGAVDSMMSASHGAGRAMSRGQAMKASELEFVKFMDRFKIITPIDSKSPQMRGRQDILQKWEEHLKQEAPWAFKEIAPVIDTQTEAGLVAAVAELEPIFTVKG